MFEELLGEDWLSCIQVVFAKTKRSNPAKTWSITKGASIPQTFLHQTPAQRFAITWGSPFLAFLPIEKPNETTKQYKWLEVISIHVFEASKPRIYPK